MSHPKSDDEPKTETVKIGKAIIPGEWVWRFLCTGLLVLNLWAKTNYVSLDGYKEDQKKAAAAQEANAASIVKIETLLTKMQEENKVNDRQEETLKDHEARLRVIERARGAP